MKAYRVRVLVDMVVYPKESDQPENADAARRIGEEEIISRLHHNYKGNIIGATATSSQRASVYDKTDE